VILAVNLLTSIANQNLNKIHPAVFGSIQAIANGKIHTIRLFLNSTNDFAEKSNITGIFEFNIYKKL